MNLLEAPWVPVRSDHGAGPFRLLTLEELLCSAGAWRISLPRDDLELAGLQLLVCMAQVMFLPKDDAELRLRCREPLTPEELFDGFRLCADWFDLAHPTYPFMQARGVNATDETPIQKLLIGLPEGNNHAFFNEAGEVRRLGGPVAAIALFNQASNSPSFGGGFQGNLRVGAMKAPITTLVSGRNLRETVWRNVVTLPRLRDYIPGYEPNLVTDRPTWVDPIGSQTTVRVNEIGLTRGLFWQPAKVELVGAASGAACDVLGVRSGPAFTSFRKQQFRFKVDGIWPHPHSPRLAMRKDGAITERFASFSTSAPAWTHLSEFVVSHPLMPEGNEGSVPAAPVYQADVFDGPLHLVVGGYRTKGASVIGRRHDLFTLSEGWHEEGKDRVRQLVKIGLAAKAALRGKLLYAMQGDKKKGMKGIRLSLHETAETMFYGQTESLFHETLRDGLSLKAWRLGKAAFIDSMTIKCEDIFEQLTDPYAHKPEFIPIITLARRGLNIDTKKLKEEA